jgi:hypothetical protein
VEPDQVAGPLHRKAGRQGTEVRAELARARDLRRQAERTQAEAATLVRDVARKLREQGLSVADVGTVLGVSFQRASQLLDTRAS